MLVIADYYGVLGHTSDPPPRLALHDWIQLISAQGMPPPVYEQTERSGPDHAPVFLITVRLADGQQAQAQGAGTKRSIEQAAAQALLDRLEGRA